MTVEPRVQRAFLEAARALQRSGIEHALVGALARAVWGRPRASTDVDFAVACDPTSLARLYDELTAARFERTLEIRAATDVNDPPELTVWRSPGGVRVDFLVTHTPFEQEALSRRVPARVGAVDTFVVSPEDLVVYKLLAGRPRDWDDVNDVVSTREATGEPFDWSYVERWCDAWEIRDRLDRWRAETGR